ncbi:uncharacterized protein LOC9656299 [Selaginella moellendorffii]|uniref:uncharacterized protein LOC9656299 n=1 Tax=Selaginella moellendorffii TaxID=88036 RepID=UPI000D1C459E|nr:uncharacterized protein LOC9656299 [Selaginella moellendorffii]|eukprot:XP_024541382.1 uncharacterized protein LOC9656299 [Selaginella moellendorffii]
MEENGRGGAMALMESRPRDQQQKEEGEDRDGEGEFLATDEEQILARVAANHLFLGQFEAFRAAIKTLSDKNAMAAIALLRAVVVVGGRMPGVLVESPAQLAWMCVLELEELDGTSIAGIELVRELVEMLLLLEMLEGKITLDGAGKREIGDGTLGSSSSKAQGSGVDATGECVDSEAASRVIDAGFSHDITFFFLGRLEGLLGSSQQGRVNSGFSAEQLEKLESWVECYTVAQPETMAAICRNIRRQSELDEEFRGDGFGFIFLQQVQLVHLKRIKEFVDRGELEKGISHLKYLDERCGVPEADFSEVVSLLGDRCVVADNKRLFSLAYEGILSSGSTRLLSVLEASQDKPIQAEQEVQGVIPRPFWSLHQQREALQQQNVSTVETVLREFMRNAFHHSRAKGEHVLETATKIALDAIRTSQLELAADVLVPFPRLRPLVAAMGWNLLTCNTTGRRNMMEILWYSESKLGKGFPTSGKLVHEVSCIEDLCDRLCYNLEVAYFVAQVKSGSRNEFEGPRLLKSESTVPSDSFAENLVLERLADESPLRVIFDMIPNLRLRDAVNLLKLQPVSSSLDLMHRHNDLELLYMHYALQATAVAMIAVTAEDKIKTAGLTSLSELQQHLEAIKTPVRRLWMLGMIVTFLQMEEEHVLEDMPIEEALQSLDTSQRLIEDREQPVMLFVRRTLEILHRYLPPSGFSLAYGKAKLDPEWRECWENERLKISRFVEDWNWRLLVVERLILRPEEQLSWKSALGILHSAPLSLLNMCILRSEYDLAKDAVQRYSLTLENNVLLHLAEWLHNAAGEKKGPEELQRFTRSLAPESSCVTCLDVAATRTSSIETSMLLLEESRSLVSEATHEQHFVPLFKRVLQRFYELLEQGHNQPLPVLLSGTSAFSGSESLRQGSKQRALTMLHQIIDDAHNGKGQFLSGKLHNLVKALADEEHEDPASRLLFYRKQQENGFALGLGFRPLLLRTHETAGSTDEALHQRPIGRRYLGPLLNKPMAYLSAFILYVATIGDIVDGVDTTHDFNFFSLLYESPGDLLTRLAFERRSTDGAAKVAEVMGIDLVHQVISACVSPVLPPSASTISQHPSHELDLDTIKFLSTLSPVRTILACVFGNKDSKIGNDFAVEQAERFPSLQRWIQMQANLQTLRDSSILSPKEALVQKETSPRRCKLKRARDSELLADEDDHDERKQAETDTQAEIPAEGAVIKEQSIPANHVWEDEYPYHEAVESLIKNGKLVDALTFADRWLKAGAPDKLLQLLIERGEDSAPSSSHLSLHHNLWNSSWQYCIRLKDKRLAATLALKYLHRWELDAAIDVLTMCSCHLPTDDVLYEEVIRVKKHLQQYRQILREDVKFENWQEVESLCDRDPEGLALRLAGKGAVTAALDIAESFKLSDDLRRELQGRQLVKLLTADPISGGGPAEAIRFLGSLNNPEDALPVAMAAMEQLPNLHSKQLLVHFLLKRQIGVLSEEEHDRMDRLALGLKMLGALPLPWQQRCVGLHEHPQLILETLLMWKQFQAASQLLNAFPSLRNDKLIITYASKAVYVAPASPERQTHYLPIKPASGNKNGNNRRFTWTPRDARNKIDGTRKRKSTLPPSQKAAWEAMAGYQEDRPIGLGPEGYEKLAPLTMTDGVLSGDPVKDEAVRSFHKYDSAPSFVLFKALLSLCFDQASAAKSAVELAVSQVQSILSADCLPAGASSEAIERAFHAAGTFVQVLLDARTQLHKLLGNKEAPSQEIPDTVSESGTDSQSATSLTKLLSEADIWLNRVELLHFLLGSGVTASVGDVADETSALLLRDRLIQEERYGMAVYTCTKCKIDVFPVWEAWGYALLRIEHYAQARLKFKKAFQLYKEDSSKIVQRIVDNVEACPAADVHAARSLYVHMAKSASSSSDDSLSADSYLNVLYIPTFTRADRSRRTTEEASERLSYFNADEISVPLSNLDNVRFEECKYYLDEYGRSLLLGFMFRHGRYREACSLFFPVGTLPPIPANLSSGSVTSLTTEYGTVDDLCDLCVGYGAIPILEHVIETRISSASSEDTQVSQHTFAALTRICFYFETHRHFNHLYRFQVLKKDYIAAGLCCIQLFLNSATQDQALRNLERAKGHFEEGLLARQQAIENVKSAAKASRGKSPSEKLTDEDLIKFSARLSVQMEVVKCFSDADGPPWKRSLFGNPNDNDTFKRRCEVAEALVEKNFDLAFQIIYDFGLPAVYIYAGVAAALAEKRKYNNLVDLLRNIKGTIDNEDLDQIIGAAISVYANRHRERPDRLIEMLSSTHRKVLACVMCGRLKTAFQIASRSNNIGDVEWVRQQARMTGALPVEDMCKQWLARAS